MMQLQQAVERLESIVVAIEEDLLDQLPYLDVQVELARGKDGRYILADAYAALVTGLAALEVTDRLSER